MNALQTVAKKCSVAVQWRGIVDGYSGHSNQYLKWCGERDPADYQTVLDYFNELDGSTYRRGTVRAKRVAVKARLRYTARALDPAERLIFEARLSDLEKDCPAPKVQQAPVAVSKILSQDDFKRCQAAAAPRQWGLFTFGYATGCRVSEVIGIRLTDCTVDGKRVEIRVVGKGKKERTVRIPATLFNRLREIYSGQEHLFETSTGRPYGRVQASDAVKRLTARVLERPLSYHKLRHSFASAKVRDFPGSLTAISLCLGHSSTAITTSFYVHQELDDEQLFAAVGV
jgi:integrase/recombinase XerD